MSKTILITGASSGFGRDTAETLSRAGQRVFATMRDPQTKNPDSHVHRALQSGIVRQMVSLTVG